MATIRKIFKSDLYGLSHNFFALVIAVGLFCPLCMHGLIFMRTGIRMRTPAISASRWLIWTKDAQTWMARTQIWGRRL